MTRTTIRLDEHLLAEAKQCAIKTKRTLTQVIEDALRETLARQESTPTAATKLPTYGEGWVRPGVDIRNMASLLDVMEGRDDPA